MLKYKSLEHTADIGFFIYGKDLRQLFRHAAEVFGNIVSDLKSVTPGVSQEIHIRAADREELLVRFLSELLFLFDSQKLLFSSFRFEKLNDKELICEAKGEVFDATRHPFKTELKAVTYHQLKVEERPEGLRAKVIFDV